jgi:hypothetical protein
MKKIWKWIVDVSDDVLAYLLTVVGILASNYIPMLQTGEHINIELSIGRVIIAGLVALLLVGWQENKGDDKVGKKANFKLRMINAVAHGLAWPTVLKVISGLVGA